MKRDDYLKQPEVQEFVTWLRTRFETPNSFLHSWDGRKPRKSVAFSSLLDAHQRYE